MSKASTVLGELRYQLRLKLGHFGHVLAVAGVQNPPRHLVAYLVAVAGELRALAHHLGRNGVLLFKHWRHALLFRKLQRLLPPFQGQMTTDLFSERQRRLGAVGNFQHGQGRTHLKAHAVAAFGFIRAVAGERQASISTTLSSIRVKIATTLR